MKTLGAMVVTFLALTLLSVPSFAAKKALTKADLDRVTAAGEPTIIGVFGASALSGDINVTLDATPVAIVNDTTGQTALKALALNNVVGENQMANGLNVSSVTANPNSRTQGNTVLQSWGSINVTDWVTAQTTVSSSTSTSTSSETSAESSAGSGNAFADRGGTNSGDLLGNFSNKCIGLNNCQGASASSSSTAASDAEAAAGGALGIGMAPVIQAADVIVNVWEVGAGGNVNVDVEDIPTATLDGLQTGLTALALNNVVGMNQVGNGTNIAAGVITLAGTGTPLTIGGSGSVGGRTPEAQTNDLSQYRGTPSGVTIAPLSITAVGTETTSGSSTGTVQAVSSAP